MSMPAPRLTRVAVAAVALAGLGLGGCANYETLEPYQPAAGIQTDAPGVKVRNLMVVDDGGSMHLAGTLIADEQDSLSKVSGIALQQNSDPGKELTIGSVSTERAKLEPDPANPRYLVTVRGLGYKFEA